MPNISLWLIVLNAGIWTFTMVQDLRQLHGSLQRKYIRISFIYFWERQRASTKEVDENRSFIERNCCRNIVNRGNYK